MVNWCLRSNSENIYTEENAILDGYILLSPCNIIKIVRERHPLLGTFATVVGQAEVDLATTFGQRGRLAWFNDSPWRWWRRQERRRWRTCSPFLVGIQHQCACVGRHFDEAMEQPARHTNDDGSRTTSRALVGSETPKRRKKKKKIVEEVEWAHQRLRPRRFDLASGGKKNRCRRRVSKLKIHDRTWVRQSTKESQSIVEDK